MEPLLTYVYILSLDLLCVASIFLYGKYRKDNPGFYDPLHISLRISDLDCWSLTHFFFNMNQGFLFPQCFFFVMCMGTLWETFEFVYGKFQPKVFRGIGGNKDHDLWWYAKISDLIVNLLGFICGMAISPFVITFESRFLVSLLIISCNVFWMAIGFILIYFKFDI